MMKKWVHSCGVALFFCGLFSCCWAQAYHIGPEDVIEVIVWKEPDFSRQVLVRPDGKISLPVIGDVQAAGLLPDELAKKLEQAIGQYVKTPKVSVIVKEIHSRKVFVMGKVESPGAFPLQSEMTVLQAISLAGGFSDWAKKGKVVLLRKAKKGDVRMVLDI